MTNRNRKRLLIVLVSLIVTLVAIILLLNTILTSVIRNTIDDQFMEMSKSSNKEISIEKIKFNIFSTTLILKNIKISPDSNIIETLKQGKLDRASVRSVNISVLKFQGIEFVNYLRNRDFNLKKILIEGVELTVYKNNTISEEKEDTEAKAPISVDSIYIKGLNVISLGKIVVDKYTYTSINIIKDDTIVSFKGNNFEIKGLILEKSSDGDGFYSFNTEELSLRMRRQKINLSGENYFIFLRKLDFNFSDSVIAAYDLQVKPTMDKYKLGASYKYTKEVFSVDVKSIKILGYKIGKAIRQGVIDVDSIIIDGLKLDLYKDRNRPFDLDKRPLFIQQKLKMLKEHPLHIAEIKISNSDFIYALRSEDSEKLIYVDISDLEGDISFITSIKDSLRSSKKLRINLSGRLMGESDLDLKIIMPYNSSVDTFYFSGTLGSADFAKFNLALYPATGIKFKAGRLNSLKFYANASPKSAKGLMTMLYDDLEAEIPKKDVDKTNKFLSFSANAVMRPSNPNKKGKTKVALIKFDRVEYKGFGNLLWKSVQAGLVNTILPTGQTQKQENKTSKENTKKKWWKKN